MLLLISLFFSFFVSFHIFFSLLSSLSSFSLLFPFFPSLIYFSVLTSALFSSLLFSFYHSLPFLFSLLFSSTTLFLSMFPFSTPHLYSISDFLSLLPLSSVLINHSLSTSHPFSSILLMLPKLLSYFPFIIFSPTTLFPSPNHYSHSTSLFALQFKACLGSLANRCFSIFFSYFPPFLF